MDIRVFTLEVTAYKGNATALVTGEMDPKDNALRPTRYAEGIVYEGDSFLRGRN